MSVPKSHVFAKGRPSNPSEAVTSVLRYVPRVRTAWQPSRFDRQNIMPEDLGAFWAQGRGRTGPSFPNSGYFTGKTATLEENTINLIPKAELEKYMPNIHLGPKALVTPVSMMSVRAGHRVTHDMLHSYDPFIGESGKIATVDHDNITPQDPNRVALHPATIHCRGRIYRWLRRGPFFQEDHYFRRNVAPNGDAEATVTPEDIRLAKKVIRIAKKGHLKAASEEYRKFVSVPPVQVYRALTAACVGQGKIADAVAIFEDGGARLFYVTRDAEVLTNVLKAAIVARNRTRALWVYNIARGRFYENQLVRAEIDAVSLYEMSRLALDFFADEGCVEEARAVYDFMRGDESVRQLQFAATAAKQSFVTTEAASMTEFDLYKAVGLRLREALAKGEKIPAYSPALGADLAVSKNVAPVAGIVAKVLAARDAEAGITFAQKDGEAPLAFLSRRFADVDVPFVLRQCRTVRWGGADMLEAAEGSAAGPSEAQLLAYGVRVVGWLTTLSRSNSRGGAEDLAIPYLRKSKPSAVNGNVRVAFTDEVARRARLPPSEAGYKFHYGAHNRYVAESFQQIGPSIASQVLALQPTHTPISVTAALPPSASAAAARRRQRPSAGRLLGFDPAALEERRHAPRPLHSAFSSVAAAAARAAAPTRVEGGTSFGNVSSATAAGGARGGAIDVAAAQANVREDMAINADERL